jgi:hypothetical protein
MAVFLPEQDGGSAEERVLAQFDLRVPDIHERVLRRAVAASSQYFSPHFPPGAAGHVQYFHEVLGLTELLNPALRWRRDDSANVPKLIHDERRLVLIVMKGDALTGTPWSTFRRHPRSKYPKGVATEAMVVRNQLTFDIPGSTRGSETSDIDLLEGYETWALLVHNGRRAVQVEISQPTGLNSGGFVSDWGVRLLLPAMPTDGTPPVISVERFGSDGDAPPGIDIPIDPR